MKAALSRMGFEHVYHMVSVMHDPDDAQWWLRAGDAKWNKRGTFTKDDWDKLLGHCQVRHILPSYELRSPANTSSRPFAIYLLRLLQTS